MKNKSVFIEHWCYTKPELIPNENGDIVIIKKMSFGPLEVYEWGIDFNNTPYEWYNWVENDFYKYENYKKILQKKNYLIKFFHLFCFLRRMDYLNG